jgi:hypothetical protein
MAMSSMTLGPFAVDRQGTLQPREPALRPAMQFAWRGHPCEAALTGEALLFAAIAGRVPSTAERGADRETAFQEVRALPNSLPPGWRMRLLPDHRIQLETDEPVAPGQTATSLVAAMVRFALALDPYLDRLEASCGRNG